LNWGSNPTAAIKPPSHPTVIKDLPFMGKTMYKSAYSGKPLEYNRKDDELLNNAKNGNFRSPLSPDFPFMGETTTSSAYKPFKTLKNSG